MSIFMLQITLIAFGFMLSFMATSCFGNILFRKQALDIPNERSSHIAATLRGGGLSIVLIFLTLFVLTTELSHAYVLLGGAILVAVVGIVDDNKHLPPLIRIGVHSLAVLMCLAFLGVPTVSLGSIDITAPWLLYPLAAIAWVWCINLFNFMDGIDGIASLQSITMSLSAALILFIVSPQESAWIFSLLLLASVVAGFLVWNWPPAKIFMGDGASGFLGFILAGFAVLSSIQTVMNVWSWVILFGMFIVDASVTLLTRLIRREVWYQAHRQHVYQRLTMLIQNVEGIIYSPHRVRTAAHRAVGILFVLINGIWLLPWALLATMDELQAPLYATVALLPLLVLGSYIQIKRIGD